MSSFLSDNLVQRMSDIGRCIIAFSGGVDSSVVAAAAYKALGDNCLAVTGLGPALSDYDRTFAVQVAQQIGISHHFVETQEQSDPKYVKNDSRRCFYCKSELFRKLRAFANEAGFSSIVTGTNADDLGDYRPGLEAGREADVQTPLADLGLGKKDVRAIAKEWNLCVSDRPAAPCLASRIAYGVQADPTALRMIEQAEEFVRSLGFRELRVRLHEGKLGRIEIPSHELSHFLSNVDLHSLQQAFKQIGFRFVTLDLAGFRSGSLNSMIAHKSLPVLLDEPS